MFSTSLSLLNPLCACFPFVLHCVFFFFCLRPVVREDWWMQRRYAGRSASICFSDFSSPTSRSPILRLGFVCEETTLGRGHQTLGLGFGLSVWTERIKTNVHIWHWASRRACFPEPSALMVELLWKADITIFSLHYHCRENCKSLIDNTR